MQPPIPAPPAPPEIFAQAGPPEEVLIAGVLIIGIIVTGVILFPIIRAWARRIEGRSVDPALAGEVEHLRARVAELEGIDHRMAELEERVDFSERLLAQGREGQPIERKGS